MTADGASAPVPLVVDLDGTLLRTDLLLESFWKGLGVDPVGTLATTLKLMKDRAALKARLAAAHPPDVALLPVDADVVAEIEAARAAGRPVVLASGSDEALVNAVADRLGPFDAVLSSDGRRNLTAETKAAALAQRYGDRGFDYIGDSSADIPVWRRARSAYVARRSTAARARLVGGGEAAEPVGAPWRWQVLARSLRPLQWVKNVLLLLPIIAAHQLEPASILRVLVGFISFSAVASSIYIVNDLTDLDADRAHETKRHRPLAAGQLPIKVGMAASVLSALTGLALAAGLGWTMLAVIMVYLVTTLAYSMRLKRVRWADVTTLAGLYTLRVVAGAAAAGVAASGWLIAFIFPIFLALGCVKRLTELARARTKGVLPGRKYSVIDRDDLLNVAILGALGAVAVFIAYSFSDTAAALYRGGWVLWIVAFFLSIWLGRMIATGWAGRQDYDPIVFALSDRVGMALVLMSVVVLSLGAA